MDAQKVTAAKPKVKGAIYNAPIGSTLPTDASSELDCAFKALGYISEDGVTTTNSPECENVKAWGGNTVLSMQTDKKDEFKFKLFKAKRADDMTSSTTKNLNGDICI